MYRQRGVVKAVSFVGKSKGRVSLLHHMYNYRVTVFSLHRYTKINLKYPKVQ